MPFDKKKTKKVAKETGKAIGEAAKGVFDFIIPPPEKQAEKLRAKKNALKAQKSLLKEKAEIAKLKRELEGDDEDFNIFGGKGGLFG